MKNENRFWRRFFECKGVKLAIAFLLLLFMLSLVITHLPIYTEKIDLVNRFLKPSAAHWFGTDEFGRDFFVRVLYGGRASLFVGFFAMLISCSVGTLWGMLCGYLGGTVDNVLMRIVDIASAIPWLILVTIASLFLPKGVIPLTLIIGFTSWFELARLVRVETLVLKEEEYVIFAKMNGAKTALILQKHVLKGLLPTILVNAIASMSSAILTESALSFLGIGIQLPTPSWGNLLQSAKSSMFSAPWLFIIPGLFIIATVFSCNKIGQAFQQALQTQEKNL